ncbi:MAG: cobalamin-binding protein [Chitinophagaceae bacterium]|nr:MAG: cobalamin-binding protein [Chitinophagaceae bacterium]
MPVYTDITLIDLPAQPRIISLVPSLTELLYDLGLDQEVIGITRFCVHPRHWYRSKTRIGGTKDLNVSLVRNLHPHLLVASKEENIKEQVQALATDTAVWLTDIRTLEDALLLIRQAGTLTGHQQQAHRIHDIVAGSFARIRPLAAEPVRTAYLIWKNPYMTVGDDTFIHHMMAAGGFVNVFTGQQRYPVTDAGQLRAKNLQVLLLSSEPYPFREKDLDELQSQLPGVAVALVDGELFSWYGSRLQHTAAYLQKLKTQVLSSS